MRRMVRFALIALFDWLFTDRPGVFDRIGAPLLGLFPFIAMFVVTSITMLRERTTGTLERLMTMPLTRLGLVGGYGGAFALAASVQATLVSAVAFAVLGLDVAGSPWAIVVLAILNAVLGSTLGLFASAFARTEFQAVQFMPAFVLPQLLLCGLFVDRDEMSGVLHALSSVLPFTYAYDALARATEPGPLGAGLAVDVAVILLATSGALALGAVTLRRRTS